MSTADLIAEAREFTEGWVRDPNDALAWRPFDQAERIRHWEDRSKIWAAGGSPEAIELNDDIKAWEDVHAHDCRVGERRSLRELLAEGLWIAFWALATQRQRRALVRQSSFDKPGLWRRYY